MSCCSPVDSGAESKQRIRKPTSSGGRHPTRSEQPEWLPPMLATLTEERFSRPGWLYEPKFDGERCLVFRRGEHLQLLSRNRKVLNEKYPELIPAFTSQKASSFIVDGEIVAFQGTITSFAKLQGRMQVQRPSPQLRRSIPIKFYAFDLLYLNGDDLRRLPLRDRKELLHREFQFIEPLRFTEHRETKGIAYYRQACRRGWEGIIAKNGESAYASRRTRDWLKFKCINEQEFVIGGYTEPQGQRPGFGAVLVGYYAKNDKLTYAGKVGTGFDTATLWRLAAKFSAIASNDWPFAGDLLPVREAHWVKPKLVAQIAFTEWTRDGKLRHPRFLGLRTDKPAKEVVREK
ncbi:MAG: ATP-dependent DNA ligase [Acidobacteria bacterium]|nr:ATP-dependent DNA ligase [Acidobacteriota bacterium]